MFEAKAEAEAKALRARSRPTKILSSEAFDLEDLTHLVESQ